MLSKCIVVLVVFSTFIQTSIVRGSDFDDHLLQLQQDWAIVNYQIADEQKPEAFERLWERVNQLGKNYAGNATTIVWEAIIKGSYAGAISYNLLKAGKLVEEARDLLLQAEKKNASELNSTIYATLGALYYRTPGWPISFGDKEKAEVYVKKALEINPHGIDQNYYYGGMLYERGDYNNAMKYLKTAMQAPDRPGRKLADDKRRESIKEVIAALQSSM